MKITSEQKTYNYDKDNYVNLIIPIYHAQKDLIDTVSFELFVIKDTNKLRWQFFVNSELIYFNSDEYPLKNSLYNISKKEILASCINRFINTTSTKDEINLYKTSREALVKFIKSDIFIIKDLITFTDHYETNYTKYDIIKNRLKITRNYIPKAGEYHNNNILKYINNKPNNMTPNYINLNCIMNLGDSVKTYHDINIDSIIDSDKLELNLNHNIDLTNYSLYKFNINIEYKNNKDLNKWLDIIIDEDLNKITFKKKYDIDVNFDINILKYVLCYYNSTIDDYIILNVSNLSAKYINLFNSNDLSDLSDYEELPKLDFINTIRDENLSLFIKDDVDNKLFYESDNIKIIAMNEFNTIFSTFLVTDNLFKITLKNKDLNIGINKIKISIFHNGYNYTYYIIVLKLEENLSRVFRYNYLIPNKTYKTLYDGYKKKFVKIPQNELDDKLNETMYLIEYKELDESVYIKPDWLDKNKEFFNYDINLFKNLLEIKRNDTNNIITNTSTNNIINILGIENNKYAQIEDVFLNNKLTTRYDLMNYILKDSAISIQNESMSINDIMKLITLTSNKYNVTPTNINLFIISCKSTTINSKYIKGYKKFINDLEANGINIELTYVNICNNFSDQTFFKMIFKNLNYFNISNIKDEDTKYNKLFDKLYVVNQ